MRSWKGLGKGQRLGETGKLKGEGEEAGGRGLQGEEACRPEGKGAT